MTQIKRSLQAILISHTVKIQLVVLGVYILRLIRSTIFLCSFFFCVRDTRSSVSDESWDESGIVHDATLARIGLALNYCERSIVQSTNNDAVYYIASKYQPRARSLTVETHEYIQVFAHPAGARASKVNRDVCELNVLGFLPRAFQQILSWTSFVLSSLYTDLSIYWRVPRQWRQRYMKKIFRKRIVRKNIKLKKLQVDHDTCPMMSLIFSDNENNDIRASGV